MAKRRHTAGQIISKLQKAEVLREKGAKVPQVCRKLGVTEQAYFCWRKEYGGVRTDQIKRLKELEKENARLTTVATDQLSDQLLWADVVRTPTSHLSSCLPATDRA